jgi:PadR family transcriptional regulator, regulatory protein AphA
VSIKHVILGFLSESPLTGYDLKKKFSDSEILHWSGNNNQIYRTLVELHQAALVTIDVEYQENKPPRKVYTITEKGLAVLHEWLKSTPELPQFRSPLLAQLMWADHINRADLREMVSNYAAILLEHVLTLREHLRRARAQEQTEIEGFREQLLRHRLSLYELELQWVAALQQSLEAP